MNWTPDWKNVVPKLQRELVMQECDDHLTAAHGGVVKALSRFPMTKQSKLESHPNQLLLP